MKSGRDIQIITNNPLVRDVLGQHYTVQYEERTYRDVLVKVRDMVFAGHSLLTHPLSGSVKPNETPYKSIVVSKKAGPMSEEEAGIMSDVIVACDKFPLKPRAISEDILADFQVVDYTLLSGALDFDAAAGLSKINF